MEAHAQGQIELRFDVLPPATKKAADFLSKEKWLDTDDWYLAGGTALALQAGHRRSVDLDFFTTKKEFDTAQLLGHFSGNPDWTTDVHKANTIYGTLCKAKVSFIAYPFFIPKADFVRYGTIRILQPRDIAVMKIVAISQRGRKRDFYDLYWLCKNLEPLKEILPRLKEQYPSVAHDYHHILKSLVSSSGNVQNTLGHAQRWLTPGTLFICQDGNFASLCSKGV